MFDVPTKCSNGGGLRKMCSSNVYSAAMYKMKKEKSPWS
jgi:hypothetical protein